MPRGGVGDDDGNPVSKKEKTTKVESEESCSLSSSSSFGNSNIKALLTKVLTDETESTAAASDGDDQWQGTITKVPHTLHVLETEAYEPAGSEYGDCSSSSSSESSGSEYGDCSSSSSSHRNIKKVLLTDETESTAASSGHPQQRTRNAKVPHTLHVLETEVFEASGSEYGDCSSSSSGDDNSSSSDDDSEYGDCSLPSSSNRNIKKVLTDETESTAASSGRHHRFTLDLSSSTINEEYIQVRDFQFPKAAHPMPYLQGQGGYLLAILAFVGSTIANIAIRLSIAQRAQNDGQSVKAAMWSFFFVEMGQIIYFAAFWVLLASPHKKRKRYFLTKDYPEESCPRVDVFLPMCNENLQIQQITIQAALAMNYPKNKLRIYVLDDGGSDDLKDWCETHFSKSTDVNAAYIRRYKDPSIPHGAKAGNLNHALEVTKIDDDALGGGKNEEHYAAVFDADMIMVPDFLRRMVPHLMKDKKIAVAQSPIRFYNLPYGDPLGQDLSLYYDVLEPRKDALGGAWCLGTGFLFRRSAVEEVGGFPTSSITEDMNLAFYLMERGYNVAYVQEDMQIGAQPDSYAVHIRQRERWCIGAIQAAFDHRCVIFSSGAMTYRQKFVNSILTFCYFMICFTTAVSYALPFVLLCTNGPVLPFETRDDITLQMRLNAINFLAFKVMGYIYGGHLGLLRLQREFQWMHFLGPYFLKSLLRHYVFPSWCFGHKKKFKASGGAQRHDDQERYPENRTSFCRRIWYFMFKQGVWVHTLFLIILSASILRRTLLVVLYPTEFALDLVELVRNETGDPDALPSFIDLFFVYVNSHPMWFILIAQYYMPGILYALFPPLNPPMPPPADMIASLEKGDGGKYYVAKHSALLTAIYELPGASGSLMCILILIFV